MKEQLKEKMEIAVERKNWDVEKKWINEKANNSISILKLNVGGSMQ